MAKCGHPAKGFRVYADGPTWQLMCGIRLLLANDTEVYIQSYS